MGAFAILAVLVAVLIGAAAYSIDVHGRKGDMEKEITRLCESRGGAVFFDVHGENKMVYACNDDGKLRVRAY